MYRPPSDPRDRPLVEQPSWGNVFAGYALVAAFFVLLWAVSHPLAGAVALAATAGLFVGACRTARLVRCFRDCGGFAFDLGGRVRITVTQAHTDCSM